MSCIKKDFIRFLVVICVVLLTGVAGAEPRNDFVKFMDAIGNDALPGPWIDPAKKVKESPSARRARIRMIVEVIVNQAPISAEEFGWFWSVDDLAMAALTKTWYESGRFLIEVHEGTKKGDRGKSVCLGQIWGGKTRGENKIIGTDRESTRRCIVEVMRHLSTHQNRCLNEQAPPSPWAIAKVFAGYGTGHSCNGNSVINVKDDTGKIVEKEYWARDRAHTWWKMRKQWQQTLSSLGVERHLDTVKVTGSNPV